MRRKKRRRQRSVLPLVLVGFAVIFLVTLWVSKRPTIETSGQSVAGPLTKNAPFPKMTIEEASVSDKYYYGQLTDKEKIAYKEVLQGIQTQEKEIRLHLKNVNEVDKIYKYVLNDFPELFWWDGSASITTDANVLQSYPILTPNYQYQGAELEAKKQEIEQSVQACLNGISSEAGEYEKIKYVYEYLIQNTDYNMEAPDNQNIYSVFIHRQSVCAGYSKAAQYLLNRMGVFCIYVTGTAVTKTAPEGQPHAWNLVRCEGEYYNMDTTWGDPVFLQEETAMRSSQISYDYLCCSDEQLFRTHTPEQTVKYPSCTATTYNYYV
ncbi:MAG: transglutaminase domain-containing protein, partial [Lachnospiraceae bacterium]